ncbi:MAG: substrate-binding domain-containing protein, partial [Bacteroidota bacterium]
RIAMINGDLGFYSARERLNGYYRALAERGLPVDPALVVAGEFSEAEGFKHALELMSLPDPPTAIFAGDDLLAVGAINGLHHLGLVVPRDVSVVGFDDIPLARYLTPPLTTVRLPIWDMGVAAAERLQQIITPGKHQPRQILFEVEFVARGSSGRRMD